MNHIGPVRTVTKSTAGDVDINGDLVNHMSTCGTALAPPPYRERPGFAGRIAAAGGDPEAVRRMLGVTA